MAVPDEVSNKASAARRGACRVVRALLGRTALGVLLVSPVFTAPPAARAQETVPAIADSPTAQALFDDAQSQAAGNPAEAARLVRRLLDEYRGQVLRVASDPEERFASAGDEAERFLFRHPEVLARFRAAESRGAERLLEERGARVAAAARRLTPAGLKASLALAEAALLRDAPDEARATLGRVASHPDLEGRELIAYEALLAVASRRLGDGAAADAALARLDRLRDEPGATDAGRAEIDAARALARRTARKPTGSAARSPLVAGDAAEVPAADWREIWSVELDATLFRRIFGPAASAVSARTVERARQDANWMTAVPTVLGRTVFVCEGQRVRALDVDSRDERWSRALGGVGVERDVGGVVDLSAIAVDGGALVVFGGHAFPNARSGPSRVWCLDPSDGAVLWSVDLDGHERRAELSGLYPVGAPILLPEVVVIAGRKSTQRLEQVDWLVALDRADGSVRWASSVAGAPSTRMTAARRHAGLVRDGDGVVVASPLGVTARFRGEDGAIEWLRRVSIPLREQRGSAEPWESGGPVVSGGRVIVLSPDESEVHALDRATGTLLEARPSGLGSGWEAPRYLLGATIGSDGPPIVLGVGADIVAYDPRDLGSRIWSMSESLREAGVSRAGGENRGGVRGRVGIAGSAVLVPGVEDLLVLALESGRVLARIEGQRPANAVLLADRIVAAGDDALRVLMPSERAETILRARLAASPEDPGAALALLELSRATGRTALAMDSARVGVAAVVRGVGGAAIRSALLDQLVELAAAAPAVGEEAYALAGQLADSPPLRVRLALARGGQLRASGDLAGAADSWSRLAADGELSREFVSAEGVSRSARSVAVRGIARALADDDAVAARRDAAADAALAELLAGDASDAALGAFIEGNPRTRAAAEAAGVLSRRGGQGLADAALLAVLHDCLVPPARMDLVDEITSRLAGDTAPDRMREATRVRRRVAELLVASGLDSPLLGARSVRFPAVGAEPGAGVDLRARLARLTGGAFLGRDPSLILAVADGALVRLDSSAGAGQLAAMWRLRLDDRDPTVLHAGRRVVVWQALPGVTDSAVVLDAATGVVEFSTPRSSEIWAAGNDAPERPDGGAAPDGGAFVPVQVLPYCDGDSLVLVRRNGDLARFDCMGQGAAPRTARGVLRQVFSASLDDGFLALAGRGGPRSNPRPQALCLDARTLEPRHAIEPVSGQEIRWVRATALGEIFLGTAAGIERWVVGADGTPRPVLVTVASDVAATDAPNLLGARILVLDRNDRPLLLPIYDGPIAPLEYPGETDGGEMGQSASLRGLLPLESGLLVHLENRCILLGHDGTVRGVDSMAGERNFAFVLPTQDALLVFNGLGGRQVPGAGAGAFRIDFSYLLQRVDPAKGLRLEGLPLELRCPNQRADRALVVDGWVLLSSSQGTLAVPLPVDNR